MAVHLVLQNDQGTITNANAYIPVSDPNAWASPPDPTVTTTMPFGFYQYQYDRGQIVSSTVDGSGNILTMTASDNTVFTADQVASAIIRATDYIDKRFNFIGWRRYSNQPTAWPRWDAVDINDRYLRGIPQAVQQATAEYALRALRAVLVTDPTRDATGQTIKSQTKKLGPLETQTVFGSAFEMPKYPAADAILRSWGLIIQGGRIVRG